MRNRLSREVRTALAHLFLALLPAANGVPAQEPAHSDTSLAGRLATVEPANRRMTVVPDGEFRTQEVFVAADAKILHEDEQEELTLSDLAVHVGRRVTVFYRLEQNRRVSRRVIVEADRSRRAHAPPMPPILQP